MNPTTPWQFVNPVVDLGGPIWKDRIWYYGGFAYQRNS
jgi:hypothetical protein